MSKTLTKRDDDDHEGYARLPSMVRHMLIMAKTGSLNNLKQ
jgi:hypothetical protein